MRGKLLNRVSLRALEAPRFVSSASHRPIVCVKWAVRRARRRVRVWTGDSRRSDAYLACKGLPPFPRWLKGIRDLGLLRAASRSPARPPAAACPVPRSAAIRELTAEYRGRRVGSGGARVRTRQVIATELVDEAIRRIDAHNPSVNAVVYTTMRQARAAARGALPDGPGVHRRPVSAEGPALHLRRDPDAAAETVCCATSAMPTPQRDRPALRGGWRGAARQDQATPELRR